MRLIWLLAGRCGRLVPAGESRICILRTLLLLHRFTLARPRRTLFGATMDAPDSSDATEMLEAYGQPVLARLGSGGTSTDS